MSFSPYNATTSLTHICRRFARDERGAATVLVGAALFVMVVAVGAAVDMSRLSALQSRLGQTLDAATIAAAQASLSVPCNTDPQTWVQQQGQAAFNANFPSGYLQSSAFTPTFTLTQQTAQNSAGVQYASSVVGSADTNIALPFMQMVGQSSVPVDACSMVHIPVNQYLGPSASNTSPHVQGDITTGLFTMATGANGQGTDGTPDTVGIATGGTGQFLVGNGNIWVGSSVDGAADAYTAYGPAFHINGANDDNTDDVFFRTIFDSSDMTELRLVIGDNAADPFVTGGSGDAFVIGALDSSNSSNRDAWTPRFTFTGQGQLGISTQSPDAQLEVVGGDSESVFHLYGNVDLGGSSGVQGNIWMGGNVDMNYDGGGDAAFVFRNTGISTGLTVFSDNNNNTLLSLNNNGNVGIGTQSPQGMLHIVDTYSASNSNGNGIIVEGNSSSANPTSPRIALVDDNGGTVTTNPAWLIDNSHDSFRIFRQPNITTGGHEYFTIDSSGNTGIGDPSTNPNIIPVIRGHEWQPRGTLDVENGGNDATICLNNVCTYYVLPETCTSDGMYLVYYASSGWTCGSAPASTTTTQYVTTSGVSLPSCASGAVLTYTSGSWGCACPPGQTAYDGAGGAGSASNSRLTCETTQQGQ